MKRVARIVIAIAYALVVVALYQTAKHETRKAEQAAMLAVP